MNTFSFQLDSLDRAYSRFANMSAMRIIIGHLTSKFWSLAFFTAATSCMISAFSLTPFSSEAPLPIFVYLLTSIVFGLSFTVCAHILGATSHLLDRNIIKLAIKVTFCAVAGGLAVSIIVGFVAYQPVGRYIIVIATVSTICVAILVRSATWIFSDAYMPVISLIGDRKFCEDTCDYLKAQPLPVKVRTLSLVEGGIEPVFIPDFKHSSYPVSLARLSEWMDDTHADTIVYQPDHWEVLEDPLVKALAGGKSVSPFSEYVEERYQTMPTSEISNSALFSKSFANSSPSYLLGKRISDLVLASVGLLCSLPLLLIAAVLIKIEDGGPVFYNQIRVGRYGQLFSIYKIRSMCTDSEISGAKWASKSDSRITRVGKILRKTRVDELPQFINILKGDMSFIGSRPERPEFTCTLEKDLRHYHLRHLLKPGLTGWAQINYPYGDSIEDARQKLTYDLYYVKYATLSLDLQIILRTIGAAMQGAR